MTNVVIDVCRRYLEGNVAWREDELSWWVCMELEECCSLTLNRPIIASSNVQGRKEHGWTPLDQEQKRKSGPLLEYLGFYSFINCILHNYTDIMSLCCLLLFQQILHHFCSAKPRLFQADRDIPQPNSSIKSVLLYSYL